MAGVLQTVLRCYAKNGIFSRLRWLLMARDLFHSNFKKPHKSRRCLPMGNLDLCYSDDTLVAIQDKASCNEILFGNLEIHNVFLKKYLHVKDECSKAYLLDCQEAKLVNRFDHGHVLAITKAGVIYLLDHDETLCFKRLVRVVGSEKEVLLQALDYETILSGNLSADGKFLFVYRTKILNTEGFRIELAQPNAELTRFSPGAMSCYVADHASNLLITQSLTASTKDVITVHSKHRRSICFRGYLQSASLIDKSRLLIVSFNRNTLQRVASVYDVVSKRTTCKLAAKHIASNFQISGGNIRETPILPDESEYRQETVFTESGIPITLFSPKSLLGVAPIVVQIYGCYGVPGLPPIFDSFKLFILKRGWRFAFVHVRGGNEKGTAWYLDGVGPLKKNGVADCLDAVGFLHKVGIAEPSTSCLYGFSAGATVAAAVLNTGKNLFRLAILDRGVLNLSSFLSDKRIPYACSDHSEFTPEICPFIGLEHTSDCSVLVHLHRYDERIPLECATSWVDKRLSLNKPTDILISNHRGHNLKPGSSEENWLSMKFVSFLAMHNTPV